MDNKAYIDLERVHVTLSEKQIKMEAQDRMILEEPTHLHVNMHI